MTDIYYLITVHIKKNLIHKSCIKSYHTVDEAKKELKTTTPYMYSSYLKPKFKIDELTGRSPVYGLVQGYDSFFRLFSNKKYRLAYVQKSKMYECFTPLTVKELEFEQNEIQKKINGIYFLESFNSPQEEITAAENENGLEYIKIDKINTEFKKQKLSQMSDDEL